MALGTAKAVSSVTLYPEVPAKLPRSTSCPARRSRAGIFSSAWTTRNRRSQSRRPSIALEQAQAALERQQTRRNRIRSPTWRFQTPRPPRAWRRSNSRQPEIDLGRRSITAPFSGITGLTDLSIGDFVTTTTPLATVDDFSTMRVEFEIPERWSGRIDKSRHHRYAQALPDRRSPGKSAARQPRRRDHAYARLQAISPTTPAC